MKATIHEWRDGSLEAFKRQRKQIVHQINKLVVQQSDLDTLIKALETAEISRRPKSAPEEGADRAKPKRKVSPEGLAKIRAANKKMWAKRRKEKKA